MALQLLSSMLRLTPDNSKKGEEKDDNDEMAEEEKTDLNPTRTAAAVATVAATAARRDSTATSPTATATARPRTSFAVPTWTMMTNNNNNEETTTSPQPLPTATPTVAKNNDSRTKTTSTAFLPRRPSTRQSQQQHIYARNQSLSRIFNQVPRDRPSFRQARQDLIEYYAHLALLEISNSDGGTGADPQQQQQHVNSALEDDAQFLQQALQGCKIRHYGRVWSRLQIAALCLHIGTLNVSDSGGGRSACGGSLQLSSPMWQKLRQELAQCRKFLMRQDANANVPIQINTITNTSNDGDDEANMNIPEPCETLDLLLHGHVMFDVDYKEVDLLLQVQEILAALRQELSKIEESSTSTRDDDDYNNEEKNPNDGDDEVKAAVDAYQQSLKQVFHGNAAAALPPVALVPVAAADSMSASPTLPPTTLPTSPTATTTTSPVIIPDELVNFLKKVEEEESKTSFSTGAAASRTMSEHVNNHLLLNATSAYSHANIKQKVSCCAVAFFCFALFFLLKSPLILSLFLFL
jgi:hypothetical protein